MRLRETGNAVLDEEIARGVQAVAGLDVMSAREGYQGASAAMAPREDDAAGAGRGPKPGPAG
ncbi:hypothetical protein ACQEVF_50220 [Nonomuraea polychroma]|uniref:hypothetical protein n=1 Tax=Nonomuraea polychroma TaxID=46176 RepID=UPI003D92F3D2